jgi:hypothetical protein
MPTSKKIHRGPGWSAVEFQEFVDVTMSSEPDPEWVFTDPAGHVHRYHQRPGNWGRMVVPTAIWKSIPAIDEEGQEYDRGYFACLECGARVDPGMRPTTSQKLSPGLNGFDGSFLCKKPPQVGETFDLAKFIQGLEGSAVCVSVGKSISSDSEVNFDVGWRSLGPITTTSQP